MLAHYFKSVDELTLDLAALPPSEVGHCRIRLSQQPRPCSTALGGRASSLHCLLIDVAVVAPALEACCVGEEGTVLSRMSWSTPVNVYDLVGK